MMSFLSWLAGTKAGRTLTAIGAALAIFFYAILRAASFGAAQEKSKQDKASLEAQRDRSRIDDDLSKMSDDDVDRELSQWVRKPGKS